MKLFLALIMSFGLSVGYAAEPTKDQPKSSEMKLAKKKADKDKEAKEAKEAQKAKSDPKK